MANKKYTARIIVTTHKRYRMPEDNIYLPLLVGAALEKDENKTLSLEYLCDNIGDNISEKNPHYCELTGLYWAWKHVNTDYVGLVHYRRHFKGSGSKKSGIVNDIFDYVITYNDLKPMLGKVRVFVPAKRKYVIETLYSHYAHTHYAEHLDKTRSILELRHPDYVEDFDAVMKQREGHMFNMMIMDRKCLNEYCEWLFDILFTLESMVSSQSYSYYQGRYSGRVGELIFNVWLHHQVRTGALDPSEIKEIPFLYVERVNWWKKGTQFLRAKFLHRKYETQ